MTKPFSMPIAATSLPSRWMRSTSSAVYAISTWSGYISAMRWIARNFVSASSFARSYASGVRSVWPT